MVQSSVWYNLCHVCQGRCTIPCSKCSGVGHTTDATPVQAGSQPTYGTASAPAYQRAALAKRDDCPDCRGTGAVRCTGCRGHGIKGGPAFAGPIY